METSIGNKETGFKINNAANDPVNNMDCKGNNAACMTITEVREDDAASLLEIYAPYVRDTAISFEYDVPVPEEFRNRIREISARYPYLKATDQNGEVLGYAYAASFKSRKAYDWSVETTVYLRQDMRGGGIGRSLYEELEARLKQRGFLNMNACIAVPKPGDPYLTDASILFHHAMGFQDVGTFHNSGFKFGRWYDMIWMEKLIGEHGSFHQRPF